jgi:hypothetical protein
LLIQLMNSILVVASLACLPIWAQTPGSAVWLNIDYTYSDFTYKEPLMSEKGRLAGVRGDVGIGLASFLGVSAGGEYQNGNLTYDGSTFDGAMVKVVTKDSIRDLRAMVHIYMGSLVLSGGTAQRELYNDLVISYRRRQIYDYYPVTLTLYRRNLYVKLETDIWRKGTNKTYMSDVNPAERDVEFSQTSGSGYGAEVGCLIPNPWGFFTRVFLAYHRWDVAESNMQNDGVLNLVEPKNNTVTIQAGIGLSF